MGNSHSVHNDRPDYCDADVKDSLITLENLTNQRGVAFIVSNAYPCGKKELHSSIEDSKKMEDLFKEEGINYSPYVRTQVMYKNFIATCKYLATYEHYPTTCKTIVIYFAGHGGKGFITMEAEKGMEKTRVDLQKLRSLFNKTELAKVFFIDSCRGSGSDPGSSSSAATINDSANNGFGATSDSDVKDIKQSSNELIAYATSEGYVAHSDKDQGGSWTNTLVLQLRKSKDKPITNVLHDVNRLMKYKQHGSRMAPKFQTPEAIDRLITDIYLWDRTGGNEINSGSAEVSDPLNEGEISSLNHQLANLQPPAADDTLTVMPASINPTQPPIGDNRCEVLAPDTSGEVENRPLANQHPIQAETKLVYVIHLSDSEQWVMVELKPILTELNINMFSSHDFIPGKTKAQAHSDSIKKAEKVIVVFSRLTVEDNEQSTEQKWFKFALSQAEHKDPDPSKISVIPILHGAVTHASLPERIRNTISLATNDPQFKRKIQESVFHHDS